MTPIAAPSAPKSATVRRRPLRICLIGPHGAGKSTLARRLAERLRCPALPEIGRVLRERALAADPARHALRPDTDFDRAVFDAERARDAELRGDVVLETWHPGNVGYVSVRTPDLLGPLEPAARAAACRLDAVVVQPLTAAREVLRRRLTEPGGEPEERLDFFGAVAASAVGFARRWGLPVLPPIDTGALDVEGAVRAILASLDEPAAFVGAT